MGRKLRAAKKLDYVMPKGDRIRIDAAEWLAFGAWLLSVLLLLLHAKDSASFALWLTVCVASGAALLAATAILLKELFRNRFFTAVVAFIFDLLVIAAYVCIIIVTR